MGYYFVSIGGSGSKTLESLLHFCAAGILPESDDKLKIFAVDPDTGNGNLQRTTTTFNDYRNLQNLKFGMGKPIFKTDISKIDPYPWQLVDEEVTLDYMVGYARYRDTPLGDLFEVLYTKKERNTTLDKGFRGHPSIGAAVLGKNYVMIGKDENKWDNLIENIKSDISSGKNAKIFLVGSVFGGTGAAGLPTISRLLKEEFSKNANNDKIFIGGALILPYFEFTAPDNEQELFAQSKNFLINTKAALDYYAQKDNVFNTMYFVGDSYTTHIEKFSIGATNQRNNAHMVDFYAALAAIDFFQQDIERGTKDFKYICHHEPSKFDWNDFTGLTPDIKKPFVKFTKFIFAYNHLIRPIIHKLLDGTERQQYKYPWFIDLIADEHVEDSTISNFDNYTKDFVIWLEQLENMDTIGKRSVTLIKPEAFSSASDELTHPEDFTSLDGVNNPDLSLNEVWYRLTEPLNNVDYTGAEGFGKFLRRLYEACEG